MAQSFDFYDMIHTFSLRNNSPYISIDILVKFLQRNAERPAAPPQLKFWGTETQEKVFRELARLTDEEKCIVQGEAGKQRIFLPIFFVEKLENIYFMMDAKIDRPFPSEENLKWSIPQAYIREISVDSGMLEYFSEPQRTIFPIIKLVFPERFGSALTLSTHLPRRILGTALRKIKYSLQRSNEMDYYMQKLLAHFSGQHIRVKRFIDNLAVNQLESLKEIEEANDFTFSAWIYLCPMIKERIMDIMNLDNEISAEMTALYQSVTLMLVITNYYKIVNINERNKDMAFSAVHEKMGELPYMYNFDEIMKFTGSGGVIILQRFAEKDLKDWLNKQMTYNNEILPAILKFELPETKEIFVRKDRVLPLCWYMLKDIQSKVKSDIVNRWIKLMKELYKEKAMEENSDFETLVSKTIKLYAPVLIGILHDRKLPIVQHEIIMSSAEPSKIEKIFEGNKLISLRKLLDLKRESLLLQCKFSLPLWHSIPIFVSIGRFFKHGLKKENSYYKESEKQQTDANYKQNLKKSAEKILKEMVPDASSADDYIKNIHDRWNQLINKSANERLTKDINTIITNYMRNAIKMFGSRILNQSMLDDLAGSIIRVNPPLAKITNKNALRLYIKLFITKMLATSAY
ncbi:MAG: hypothetical protein LBB22_01255 [Treponema sp.]|jgi:hypothetical protein|nr:hypothetical protein [Treponema sp.]